MNLINKGFVEYRVPSNIAFIKYWGKRDRQIPQNASLSMTLSECYSQTKVSFIKAESFSLDKLILDEIINEEFRKSAEIKILSLLELIPFLKTYKISIETSNSFPHSSGIASSASGFAAIVMCLLQMDAKLKSSSIDLSFASELSRLCSGSASRSVFSGYAHWGKSSLSDSSNQFAVAYNSSLDLCDAIAIVNESSKSVSSSAGHSLMETNPYKDARYANARVNFDELLLAMESGDIFKFGEIIEKEALELHSLMMSSTPSYILLEPASLSIIKAVREYRLLTNEPLFFTIDAGPNIHLIYPKDKKNIIEAFIKESISPICKTVLYDFKGTGPCLIDEKYETL